MNTLRYTISILLGFALPYVVQRWDRDHLSPQQQDAAWNGATWGAAVYAFGPLSMLGWAWVTRARFRAWRRDAGVVPALCLSLAVLLAGLLAAMAMFGVIVGADWAVGRLVGAPD